MKIRLITCGGTIDCKTIDKHAVYAFEASYIPEMLKQGGCTAAIELHCLMAKDSLLMNDEDRQRILEVCRNSREDRIIITHGTDTLVETARLLGQGLTDKVIVLLGAMVPFNQEKSDALFNLGAAVTAVQLLPGGVYIAMNGEIFAWDNVKKNKELRRFERLSGGC